MAKKKTNSKHGTLSERKAIAARFLDYRKKFMLTQSEMGKLMDLERSYISDVENAKHMPSYSTMRRFVALEAKGKEGVSEKVLSR